MNTRTTLTAGGTLLALMIGFTTVNPVATKADSTSLTESSDKETPANPTHDLNAVAYGKTVQSELEARYARYGAIQKKPIPKPAATPTSETKNADDATESKKRWSISNLFGGKAKNETAVTENKTPEIKTATISTPEKTKAAAKPEKQLLLASAAKQVSAKKTTHKKSASKKTEKKRVPLITVLTKKSTKQNKISTKPVQTKEQQTKAEPQNSPRNNAPRIVAAGKPNDAVLNELNKLYKQNGGQMPPMDLSKFPKSNQGAQSQNQTGTQSSRVVITKQSAKKPAATSAAVKSNTKPSHPSNLTAKRNEKSGSAKHTKNTSARKPLFSFGKSKSKDPAFKVAEPVDPADQHVTQIKATQQKKQSKVVKPAPRTSANKVNTPRKPIISSKSPSTKKPVKQVAHQDAQQPKAKSSKRPGLLNRLGLFGSKKNDYSNLPPEPVEPPKKIAKQSKAKSLQPSNLKPAPPAVPALPAAPAPPALAKEEIPVLKKVAEKPAENEQAKAKAPVVAEKPAKTKATPYTGLTLKEESPASQEIKPTVKTVSGSKAKVDESEYYKLPQIRPKNGQAAKNTKSAKMQQIAERKDANGLKGFCPVVLRDERNLVDAKPLFHSKHDGNIYYFSSAIAKLKFDQQPDNYAPAAGGNDVVLAKTNQVKTKGSLDNAVWFRDRLFLFASQANKAAFVAEPAKFLEK